VARQYRLPSFVAGAWGDSKLSDAQLGHKKALTGLMAALAGANLIFGSGMVESGMTFDYGQLVMDNEFAGMIKHCVGGIPVSDESLAVDVIHVVGPSRDFLTHEHTYKHMKLHSRPELGRPARARGLGGVGRHRHLRTCLREGEDDPGDAQAGAGPRRRGRNDPRDSGDGGPGAQGLLTEEWAAREVADPTRRETGRGKKRTNCMRDPFNRLEATTRSCGSA